MTMIPSAVVRGCRFPRRPRRRGVGVLALCSVVAAHAFCASANASEVRAGAGVATFDGAGPTDGRSRGLDVFADWRVRDAWSLRVGVIDQSGDFAITLPPTHGLDYGWRAWHLGPRWSLSLGQRAQLELGLSAAHVTRDREAVEFVHTGPDGIIEARHLGTYRDSGWGALASLGVAFDLDARQQVRVEYRRVHAGLAQRCEIFEGGYLECNLPAYASVDGLGVSWSYGFD